MKQNLYRGKLTDRFKDLENLRPDLVEKGIVKDGWIYGSLIVDEESGRTYICIHATCSHNTYINNGISTMFEIIPETVGQYICINDKNNKNIFEGDIVKDGVNAICAVKQCKGFYYPFIAFPEYKSWSEYECTVIGNIHDNPELLKGEN